MSFVQIVDSPQQPEVSSHLCLHELLTRQARLSPEVVAVVEGANSLTYRQLEEQANQLAHALRALGVRPEMVVVLALKPGRSQVQALVALFAILKAGGAVLVLSEFYPPATLGGMLEEAQVGLIVAVEGLEGRRLGAINSKHVSIICLDDAALKPQVAHQPPTPPLSGVTVKNLAYVIYTSGSTGTPKGVLCTHAHLAPLGEAQGRLYEIQVGDRMAQTFNWQFDGFFSGLVTAIANGATLCLPSQEALSSGTQAAAWVEREHMQNFPLLQAVGRSGKPVLLKRGFSATIDEWLLSAEYIYNSGNPNIVLCERGIRSFDPRTRNLLDLSCIPLLAHLTHLPVVVDPSHSTGRRELVGPMAYAAIAAGADGLLIDVHHQPEQALCDGDQALLPDVLTQIVSGAERIHEALQAVSLVPV